MSNRPKPLVLIAEDDILSASLLTQLLDDDFECRVARNGSEAWDAAQKETFHLMLLDIMMPGIDGLELCRRFRKQERTASTPIIIVTARVETEDIVAGLEAGANDYIAKPVEAAILRARVATQMRMAVLRRERDELTSMMTHDLKSPLMLILGAATLLREELTNARALSPEGMKRLDTIRSNVQRMASMINNCLSLARLEGDRFPIRRERFELQDLADELFDDAMTLARDKAIQLVCESASLPETIEADREALGRAMNNILGNALKFTPSGGRVLARLIGDDGRISLTVEDSGPGLPPGLVPHLFERYVRGASSVEGAGLGLRIAKLVAEAHGGALAAENRPEGGARFSLSIPVILPEGASPSAFSAPGG